jgi:hypothetical protein
MSPLKYFGLPPKSWPSRKSVPMNVWIVPFNARTGPDAVPSSTPSM